MFWACATYLASCKYLHTKHINKMFILCLISARIHYSQRLFPTKLLNYLLLQFSCVWMYVLWAGFYLSSLIQRPIFMWVCVWISTAFPCGFVCVMSAEVCLLWVCQPSLQPCSGASSSTLQLFIEPRTWGCVCAQACVYCVSLSFYHSCYLKH